MFSKGDRLPAGAGDYLPAFGTERKANDAIQEIEGQDRQVERYFVPFSYWPSFHFGVAGCAINFPKIL